jgi:hypothetical protein
VPAVGFDASVRVNVYVPCGVPVGAVTARFTALEGEELTLQVIPDPAGGAQVV